MSIELAVIAALVALARTTRSNARMSRDAADAAPQSANHRRWRIAIAATIVMVPVVGMAALFTPGVQQRLFDAGAERQASVVNTAPLADDALRVAVCGSSAPLPSAARAKACVAVFAGGKFYIVDAGPESVENLVLWGIPMGSVGGVLLTHFHSDHIGDLGELNLQTWVGGRPGPLAGIRRPGRRPRRGRLQPGVPPRSGVPNRAPRRTRDARRRGRWSRAPSTLDGPETPAKDRTALVLDDGGLRITAIEVDHAPISPAYAYRFDYKGRSAFITGDLKYHPPLIKAAQGVDVLVSEAIAVSMTRALGRGAAAAGRDRTAAVMHDIEDYHITPEQAAAIANDAHARLLVFYHLLPAPDGFLARRVFAPRRRRGAHRRLDDRRRRQPLHDADRVDAVRIGRVTE